MYKAIDVAKYVIEYEDSQGRSVSNLRLQKLLYYIQAQFLVSKGEECFADRIEAWDFGPVIPNVYHVFKFFGSLEIPVSLANKRAPIYADDEQLINDMLDYCARYSTSSLVYRTHNQKPWIDARKKGKNGVITAKAIREYFEE